MLNGVKPLISVSFRLFSFLREALREAHSKFLRVFQNTKKNKKLATITASFLVEVLKREL